MNSGYDLAFFLTCLDRLTLACLAVPVKNGFDLANALAPAAQITAGGALQDSITALDAPPSYPQ